MIRSKIQKNDIYSRTHDFAKIRNNLFDPSLSIFNDGITFRGEQRLAKKKKKKKRKCQSGVDGGGRGKYQIVGCGEEKLASSLSLFITHGFSVFAAKREEPCTHA